MQTTVCNICNNLGMLSQLLCLQQHTPGPAWLKSAMYALSNLLLSPCHATDWLDYAVHAVIVGLYVPDPRGSKCV